MNLRAIALIRLTPDARGVIEKWLADPRLHGHLPTITWMGDARGKKWSWAVGTYLRDDVPESAIVDVDGIYFVIEEQHRLNLAGKTLIQHVSYAADFPIRRDLSIVAIAVELALDPLSEVFQIELGGNEQRFAQESDDRGLLIERFLL